MSVRARLTLAVALLVGALAALAALVAPGRVEDALVDDLLNADAESQLGIGRFDSNVFDGDVFGEDVLGGDVGFGEIIGGVIGEIIAGDSFGFELFGRSLVSELDAERLDEIRRLSGTDVVLVALGGSEFIEVGTDGSQRSVDVDIDQLDQPVIALSEVVELSFGDRFDPAGRGDPDDGSELLISGVRAVDGVDVIVFADGGSVERTVSRVSTALWSFLPISVVAAGLATWLLAGRALRPVAAITAQTERITSGTLDERVPVPDSGDEIATLATTMNTMLDRLEVDDRRRRRFVSDASHELRSPVAILKSEAEVALRSPERTSVDELASGVLHESGRLASIIDDLLALARHDEGLPPPSMPIDLDDIVFVEAARSRAVPVDTGGVSAGRVLGRPDELSSMVAHLLDNAARHANSVVAVTLIVLKGRVFLTVDDDGPGIDAADRERVFERFTRLDDARTRDRGGAGLGLAVVAGVVERSGGSVSIDDSPAGGARLIVELPAA